MVDNMLDIFHIYKVTHYIFLLFLFNYRKSVTKALNSLQR